LPVVISILSYNLYVIAHRAYFKVYSTNFYLIVNVICYKKVLYGRKGEGIW